MEYTALIFARYNSSRLPGKVLFELGTTTILGVVVDKLRKVENLRVVVATSDQPTDEPVAQWCAKEGVAIFRGDLNNVAARTAACLRRETADAFFRVNADSPFLQPDLLKRAQAELEQEPGTDMVTNILERSYPYGIAVELLRRQLFLDQVGNFKGDECEHITSYFYRHKSDFVIRNIRNQEDLSSYKFVLDTPEEWEELKSLYARDSTVLNYNVNELVTINNNKHKQ